MKPINKEHKKLFLISFLIGLMFLGVLGIGIGIGNGIGTSKTTQKCNQYIENIENKGQNFEFVDVSTPFASPNYTGLNISINYNLSNG